MPSNLSPEWIAETSSKLNYISNKIDNYNMPKDQGSKYIIHAHQSPQIYQSAGLTQRQAKTFESTQEKNIIKTGQQAKLHDMPFAEMFQSVRQELVLAINTIQMKIRRFSSSFDFMGGS